jgi:SAM-dependent methyltransferase
MTEKNYEYHGMIAEYWDLLRGDTSGWSSRPYFLQAIRRSGEPVLDVGCGTGRLLLDYMQEGIDIDGVDVSPEMLAVCRSNADELGLNPRLYQGAMEDFDIPRKYQTIIVPSSSFLLVTKREAQLKALSQFMDHLLPGGLLSMSLRWFDPDPVEEEEFAVIAEAVRPSDGALVRRWFRATYDLDRRVQNTWDRYEVVRNGEIIESESHSWSPAMTWYFPSEAVALFKEAGYVDGRAYADFTREPATDADQSYTVEGRKT